MMRSFTKTPSRKDGVFLLLVFILLTVNFQPRSLSAQSLSGLWSSASSTGFSPRAAFAACVVDGKIYALGGYDGSEFLDTLEVFDPVLNAWNAPTTSGKFTPRKGLCCAVVGGKIYTLGGYDSSGASNIVEVFDPQTRLWESLTTTGTFTKRWRAAAVACGCCSYR
jgi:N-acetylneuraminic acid mutarotase